MKKYISRFNKIDIIAKLSALNLVFENQNKNNLLTNGILECLHNIDESDQQIDSKNFQELIDELNDDGLLDSARSSFFEIIHWTKDFHFFNGINNSSVSTLKNVADLLLFCNVELSNDFKDKISRFILCLSEISEKIWKELNLSWERISNHEYVEKIQIPNNLDQLVELVVIPKESLLKYLSEFELDQYLFCNKKIANIKKDLNENFEPFYYYCPFYDLGQNVLILDPTCFALFLNNLALRFAHEFNCVDEFLHNYHFNNFETGLLKCKVLSGINPKDKSVVSFTSRLLFHQEAYRISSTKILYACCVKQDGFSPRLDTNLLSKEVEHGYFKLKDKGYKEDSIYILYLIDSFGGNLAFSLNFKPKNKPIIVSCDDVNIIYENEKSIVHLFEGYVRFKNYYYEKGQPILFTDIDTFALLSSTNQNYYVADDIRLKDVFVSFGDDFLYPYVVKALSQENTISTFIPYSKQTIILRKYDDGIYGPDPLIGVHSNILLSAIKLKNGVISIFTEEKNQESFLICRMVGYWLHQILFRLQEKINGSIYIQIKQNNEISYECKLINTKHCVLSFSKRYIQKFSNSDNENEIKMVEEILKRLGIFSIDVVSALNQVSLNKEKKIIYTIDTNKTPFMDPLNDVDVPVSRNYMLENLWDDLIGDFLIEHNIPFGLCKNPNSTLKEIVKGLFEKLEIFLMQFNWFESIKLSYLYAENELYQLLLFQDNMRHQLALYPQKERIINQNYNDLNMLSIGCRFITEYLVSTQPEGSRIIDLPDMEYAISLIQAIIKIARVSDALYFGIIPNEVEFLKSGRIAFDNDKLDKFYNIVGSTIVEDNLKKISFEGKSPCLEVTQEMIDIAYAKEFGFTTKDLTSVFSIFSVIGFQQNNDIKIANKKEIDNKIDELNEVKIDREIFWKVVDYLSIHKREKYFDGSIDRRELYPWKYNRSNSLVRKPFIKCEDNYLWGNRTIYNSLQFIVNSIDGGYEKPLKTGEGPINELNGMMLKQKGEIFNEYCYQYLTKSMPDIKFYKNVTVVNNKKLKDDNGNLLGDIDILGLDEDTNSIYLIEVKDFFYSRDLHELADEIKDIFIGKKGKRSLLERELRRVAWFKEHIDDCKKHYNLNWEQPNIKYCFLSKKPLLSKEFIDKQINSTSIKFITLEFLRNLT